MDTDILLKLAGDGPLFNEPGSVIPSAYASVRLLLR